MYVFAKYSRIATKASKFYKDETIQHDKNALQHVYLGWRYSIISHHLHNQFKFLPLHSMKCISLQASCVKCSLRAYGSWSEPSIKSTGLFTSLTGLNASTPALTVTSPDSLPA